MQNHKTVDAFLKKQTQWRDELSRLRDIMNAAGLEETVKWGAPVYVAYGQNITGIVGFKNYFAVWFYQGALLKDEKKVLVNAQEGKTKALRQWRMESAKEIKPAVLKAYLKEAISNAERGKAIKPERKKALVTPPMLAAAFRKNKKAKAAFDGLTPGRRREYADYIAEAKRDETKAKRIEKILPMICADKGLNDKYR